MDRSAIDYLNYLENSDPFFYKNFKDFIIYASGLNKHLLDEEYMVLKESKKNDYKISLKDKQTTINIIKNFFYKISPNIIKQIDFDVNNKNIEFLPIFEFSNTYSRMIMSGGNYKIQIADTFKIDESFRLVREYAHLFAGNLLDAEGVDRGLKKVYVEVITSLTEFALAKHLSNNNVLKNDSNNYINRKLYDAIYNMNDSYMTLIYLGYLLENKSHEEILDNLGSQEVINKLDNIIRSKKPCNDYVNTLGTTIALRIANSCDDLFDLVNTYYIKAASLDINYFVENVSIELDQEKAVNEITYYIRNNK